MKRKLIKRNKMKLTELFYLPYVVRVLMYGDKHKFKEKKRTESRRVEVLDFENAFLFFGRGRICVPVLTSSTVKRSRIKNICYTSRIIGSIEIFNEMFNTNKVIEDLHGKNIYWDI